MFPLNLLRPGEGVVVAGDAGHHSPLVRHGRAAEVYKQVSQGSLGRIS